MAVNLQNLISAVELYTSSYNAQKAGITSLQNGLNSILTSIDTINNRLSELEDAIGSKCSFNICDNSSCSTEDVKRLECELNRLTEELRVVREDEVKEIRTRLDEALLRLDSAYDIFSKEIQQALQGKVDINELEVKIRETVLKFSEEIGNQKSEMSTDVDNRISKLELQIATSVQLIREMLLLSKTSKKE